MERLYRVACENNQNRRLNEYHIWKIDRRTSYLFLSGYVLLLNIERAEILVKKYKDLHIVDTYGSYLDQFTEVIKADNSEEIRLLATKFNISFQNKSIFELKINIMEAKLNKIEKSKEINNLHEAV